MDKVDLDRFELQLTTLVQRYNDINKENAYLREKQSAMQKLNRQLLEKNKKTKIKVKELIERLKAMETNDG